MFTDKMIQQHKAISMPQINLKLDGVPIKIPNRFFFKETYKKVYRKAESQGFFQETCQENLHKKANNQEQARHKLFVLQTSGYYETKVIKKHGIVTDTRKLTHETENSYR